LATLIYLNLFRRICLPSCRQISSLQLTISTLEEGLSVPASPMVDTEHDGHDLNVNMLFLVPEIAINGMFFLNKEFCANGISLRVKTEISHLVDKTIKFSLALFQ